MKEKDKRRDVRGESRERAKCQRETLGKYFSDWNNIAIPPSTNAVNVSFDKS